MDLFQYFERFSQRTDMCLDHREKLIREAFDYALTFMNDRIKHRKLRSTLVSGTKLSDVDSDHPFIGTCKRLIFTDYDSLLDRQCVSLLTAYYLMINGYLDYVIDDRETSQTTPENPEQETMDNTIPYAKNEYIFGKLINEMSQDEMIQAVAKMEESLKELNSIKAKAKAIETKKEDIRAAIARLTEELDK
jgi:hypothetical protein